jgi:hypothetical protein
MVALNRIPHNQPISVQDESSLFLFYSVRGPAIKIPLLNWNKLHI